MLTSAPSIQPWEVLSTRRPYLSYATPLLPRPFALFVSPPRPYLFVLSPPPPTSPFFLRHLRHAICSPRPSPPPLPPPRPLTLSSPAILSSFTRFFPAMNSILKLFPDLSTSSLNAADPLLAGTVLSDDSDLRSRYLIQTRLIICPPG
jgi:hypothetical protein